MKTNSESDERSECKSIYWKEQITFENMIYNDNPLFEYRDISNKDFLVSLVGLYPKLRPHYLDEYAKLVSFYLNEDSFRKDVIEKAFIACPTIFQRLYKMNVFSQDEIVYYLNIHKKKFLCLFFKDDFEIDMIEFIEDQDYNQYKCDLELNKLVCFGFYPSSLEYYLKYDDFEGLKNLADHKQLGNICKWSPFEWSLKPKNFDFLSFCGFFGSIKCFKYLLLLGSMFHENCISCLICGGSLELLMNDFLPLTNNLDLLHIASAFNRLSHIVLLIAQGNDINSRNSYNETPLHVACSHGHHNIVEYLISKGANIHPINRYNNTPLHEACSHGHLSIVEYLVSKGANINFGYGSYNTPLEEACSQGHLNIVEYLISKGANIHSKNGSNCAPLHEACSNGHLNIVEYLVSQDADIHSENNSYNTPLHEACSQGHLSIVEYLVSKGANIFSRNCYNETPLHEARSNGHTNVVEYLISKGAYFIKEEHSEDSY